MIQAAQPIKTHWYILGTSAQISTKDAESQDQLTVIVIFSNVGIYASDHLDMVVEKFNTLFYGFGCLKHGCPSFVGLVGVENLFLSL